MPRRKKTIKNFKTKLHLICGDYDFRPMLGYVHFKDDYLYATDAHILIRQHLSVHDFEPDEIALLNGKFIHRSLFQEILKYNFLNILPDGFQGINDHYKIKFNVDQPDASYPDAHKVLEGALNNIKSDKSSINHIGLNPSFLKRLTNAFVYNNEQNVELLFTGPTSPIVVKPVGYKITEQVGIIMPISLSTFIN